MSTETARKKIKILCVDDEEDILNLLKKSISMLGYEVLTSRNVDEAISLIQKESSHLGLVLSDYSMDIKNGFDLRKQMLTEYDHIPFVLISGNITKNSLQEYPDLKIADFVAKPFHHKDLLEIISIQSKERIASIRDEEEIKESFLADAEMLVEEMESLILKLENDTTNSDILNRLFACAHTIKGTSGFFKPSTIYQFMHKYEDFISTLRKNEGLLNSRAIQVLLRGLDQLKGLLTTLRDSNFPTNSLEDLISIFSIQSETENEPKEGQGIKNIDHSGKQTDELRVSLSALDKFMETSGEITVLRNMIAKVFQTIESEENLNPNFSILSELMSEMHKSVELLQDNMADIRKVSLHQVTRPLLRVVRDLSTKLRKQIHLVIKGDELRVDHTIVEALNKCLIHLVRNSADHGIEAPKERTDSNKPAHGTICLSFHETNNEIIAKLSDDGRGIHVEQVAKKAIERGILTEDEAKNKSEAQIQALIFAPGFSTAEVISDVSGRGIGTDMVRQTILDAGGKLNLQSIYGKGTEFELKLPLPKSVQIINSLIVKAQGQTIAIPQENVQRIVDLQYSSVIDKIRTIGDRIFLLTESGLVPVLSLKDIIKIQSRGTPTPPALLIILANLEKQTFCLGVDLVLGSEDTVMKPVGTWFEKLTIYKAATFMADGTVGVILDIQNISKNFISENEKTLLQPAMDSSAQAQQTHEYLSFTLGRDQIYALPKEEILRVEDITASKIHYIGPQASLIFNDKAIPLFDLEDLFKVEPESAEAEPKHLVIVLQEANSGVCFAALVRYVGDLLEVQDSNSPAFFVDNEPVHLLNNQALRVLTCTSILSKVSFKF